MKLGRQKPKVQTYAEAMAQNARMNIAALTDDLNIQATAERLADVPYLHVEGETWKGLVDLATKLHDGKEIVLNPRLK